MTKLTDKKINWIVRNVSNGKTAADDAAMIYGITPRRVRQMLREYRMTGNMHQLKWNRRPRTSLSEEQKAAIDAAWEETRLGARLLCWELRRRGHRIPKNKIRGYLAETRRSLPNPNKQKKRKRCRYERQHSLSLVHADWKEHKERHVIAFLDDASRRILSIGEFEAATTENAMSVLREAEAEAAKFNGRIAELNTDRGSQFFANKRDRKGRKGASEFERYLGSRGIRHVPSRRNNPQTNGKMERWFQEYERHRDRFQTAQQFATWYNGRLHGSLWLEYGETPDEAFRRKLRPECLLGMFSAFSGG